MRIKRLIGLGIRFCIWARRETDQRVYPSAEAAVAAALIAVYEMCTCAVSALRKDWRKTSLGAH